MEICEGGELYERTEDMKKEDPNKNLTEKQAAWVV
jgi:hypothetical protein